jgi:acylphosphatase
MTARRIFIEGKVQGVFFREWTVQRAREIGVAGWVRNLRDGRVEVYATGDAAALDRLLAELKQGSPASQVDHVEAHDAAIEPVEGFTRRQTV